MSICTVCHDKIHNDKQSDETMLVRRKTTNGYMLKEVERENIMKVPWVFMTTENQIFHG